MDQNNGVEDGRTAGELLKQLSEQMTTLVRQELELAKAEIAYKGKRAAVGAGLFGGAGLLGFFALAALTATLILALATALAGWLAALVVTVLYGATAGALALVGKNKLQEAAPPVPEQTVDSVKEDIRWTKQRARAGRQ